MTAAAAVEVTRCPDCGTDWPTAHGLAVHRGMMHGPPSEHGTHRRYSFGCRCPYCTAGHAAYHRAHRRPHPRPDPEHGTVAGYWRHYNRHEAPCEACRDAGNAAAREQHAQAKRRRLRPPLWYVVCDYLDTWGPMPAAALAERITARHPDVPHSTIRSNLTRLARAGLVDRDARGRWRVVPCTGWADRETLLA